MWNPFIGRLIDAARNELALCEQCGGSYLDTIERGSLSQAAQWPEAFQGGLALRKRPNGRSNACYVFCGPTCLDVWLDDADAPGMLARDRVQDVHAVFPGPYASLQKCRLYACQDGPVEEYLTLGAPWFDSEDPDVRNEYERRLCVPPTFSSLPCLKSWLRIYAKKLALLEAGPWNVRTKLLPREVRRSEIGNLLERPSATEAT